MQKVHQCSRVFMWAKSEFLKAKIHYHHHDPKKLWRVLGNVLCRLPAKMLSSVDPPWLLADTFRVVAVQLQTHFDKAGLMTAFQSAYRKHHSTKSALLKFFMTS